jgi:LysR family transcriptional regulator, glycine cleavage system transcriptional activator
MSKNLPPLPAIRAFEAAARHQSFTRAAEELGMTQAAVSYQLKLLEERVGAQLFVRNARGVTLSDAGRRLAPAISEAFGQMRAAFEALSETAEGILRITAGGTIATNWLVSRLGAFQLKHPGIAVSLDVTNDLVDLARADVDVGLRSGQGQWPELAAHPLMAAAFTPMLSPRLVERLGPLNDPTDLLRFPLIDPTDEWWVEWFEEASVPAPDLSNRGGIRVLNQQLAGRAALSAQGVAILMPAFFADELASGLLLQPFELVRRSSETHYWLVYSEARRRSPKIRAFRDWILAEAAAAVK